MHSWTPMCTPSLMLPLLHTGLATHCTALSVALLLWPAEACCTAVGPAAAACSGQRPHVILYGAAHSHGPGCSDDGTRRCLAWPCRPRCVSQSCPRRVMKKMAEHRCCIAKSFSDSPTGPCALASLLRSPRLFLYGAINASAASVCLCVSLLLFSLFHSTSS